MAGQHLHATPTPDPEEISIDSNLLYQSEHVSVGIASCAGTTWLEGRQAKGGRA